MRTQRRVGLKWVYLTLVALVVAVAVIHSTVQTSRAEDGDKDKAAATETQSGGGIDSIWVIQTSGLIGVVILSLSVYFVATVSRMFMELRMETAMPPEVIAQCEAMLEQRDFKGIFNVVKEDDSFFSRVLVTGITELPNGLSEARESMERMGDMLTAEMEKKISMMAVLGTLGPMIGLLGTLKGMIASFSVIAHVRRAVEGQRSGRRHFGGPAADVRGRGACRCRRFSSSRCSATGCRCISVTALTRADEFLRHFAQAARARPPAAAAGRRLPRQGISRRRNRSCRDLSPSEPKPNRI